jgi:hypothetical protein
MAEHEPKPADLGTNRTGVQANPLRSRELRENEHAAAAEPQGAIAITLRRVEASSEAPPIGSMPVPGSPEGIARTPLQGDQASVFLDKLGERLAFERTGVRIYDAVTAKLPASSTGEDSFPPDELRRFRDEELAHFLLVKEAIEQLGGDPTAVTPSADLAAVASQGVVQVVTDPRTTLTQCLDALLLVELGDNDGWRTLIAMAGALGQDALAERFAIALAEEDLHLQAIRQRLAERLGGQLGVRMPSADLGEPARPG